MGWSVQISGSSCSFSGIHLDTDGLYVNVPKFRFTLPSSIADFDNYTDVLSKLLTFRKSTYCIADAIQDPLTTKHSLERAFGRANTDENDLDPRIYWICDSYYTPPSNKPPALPTHSFDRASPPSIMSELLSASHEEKKALAPAYNDCTFDENGWAFSGDHWFNVIANSCSKSSPYEVSDEE